MTTRMVSATEFKAKCLAMLDEIEDKGASITITRRGRPVATLGPVKRKRLKSPEGSWIGKVFITGDIVNSDTADLWDVVRKR